MGGHAGVERGGPRQVGGRAGGMPGPEPGAQYLSKPERSALHRTRKLRTSRSASWPVASREAWEDKRW